VRGNPVHTSNPKGLSPSTSEIASVQITLLATVLDPTCNQTRADFYKSELYSETMPTRTVALCL
jgi:hypothetical protein